MNTFSWVICKCQSGNRAERAKPGKHCSNHPRGSCILPEPRNEKGPGQRLGRSGLPRRERKGKEGGTRGEGTRMGSSGGGRVVDVEVKRVNQGKQLNKTRGD